MGNTPPDVCPKRDACLAAIEKRIELEHAAMWAAIKATLPWKTFGALFIVLMGVLGWMTTELSGLSRAIAKGDVNQAVMMSTLQRLEKQSERGK